MGQFSFTHKANKMYKVLALAAIVALANADSPPAYGAPAPVVYKETPEPFAYEYGVSDDYSKNNFRKTETQDANGAVQGSFTIALPDGRIQTTKYTVDDYSGFVAEVTYEGTPVYPPEPKEGYGHAAPVLAYKPAVVVAPAAGYHA